MLTRRKAGPERADSVDDFIFTAVWRRQGSTRDERMLLAISSLAGNGHLDSTGNSVDTALQSDFPVGKLQEAILQTVVYCGFLSTVQAMHPWRVALRSAAGAGDVSPEDKDTLEQ
jgi:alkylhydroperoxidase/carboxymuconolactone decarboxylase family protein YurZ